MAQKRLPDINEQDRHIKPIADKDEEAGETAGEEILESEDPQEEDDGSVTFKLEGDKDERESVDFLENLAEVFDESVLGRVASDLIDFIERDQKAREKRDKQYEEGLRRTGLGDDAPGGAGFEGASKVVHPILAESCIDFESRAIKELFPPSGPVKTQIIGKKTEEKLDRADRKARYMNYQMTKQMSEYRPELEQILTQVPMGGSQYQKFWHDSVLKRPRTCFVPIDDVLLPFSTTDFYGAQRVTHVQHITAAQLDERVESGLYRDIVGSISVPDSIDETASAEANNKIEGKEQDAYNDDGLRDVFEIYAFLEFKDDDRSGGKRSPYIITIDKHTEKVLAVYRNWEENDEKRSKLDWLVEWKFIPWRGAYALGLPHLIGGLSGAATGALRALLDSAHINNSATLVKLKGGKTNGKDIVVEPTQIAEVDAPAGADDIRKVMMAMPYNPPSTVLFQLLGWLTDAGKGVIATAEEALSGVGDRTPVGTTMAMVEQGSQTYSAIHARLHYSQAKCMEILARINSHFLEDRVVVKELDELVVSRADFVNNNDIIPVSDPNIFSEAQRFAQMQGVGQVTAMFPELPFNKHAIARRMLKRMRVEDVDEILPPEKKPQNLNPVAENVAALQGTPLLALPAQDHMAHIIAHLEFAASPIYGSPILGQKLLPTIIEHVKQHLGFYYSNTMGEVTKFGERAGQVPTKAMEREIATTQQQVMAAMNKQLLGVLQGLTQLQQKAQQMAPPPPMDPSIQATKDVAMADIKRKTDRDNAELEIKRAQAQVDPALVEKEHAIQLLKNQQDNMQHQETELLKNQGDNETAQWIASMKEGNQQMMMQLQQKLDTMDRLIQAATNEQQQRIDQETELTKHENEQQTAMDQHAAEQKTALEQTQMQNDAAAEAAATQQSNGGKDG
jgi:hypothetical protein